jgi:hypothetical protein
LEGSARGSCCQHVDETVYLSVLFPGTRSFEGRRFRSVSCSQRGDEMRPIAKSEPVSIFWRAPPNSGSFLGLFPTGCAKPSSSLSCSNDEPCRHGPCSSFRSSEEPHAGFTTVVLGCLSATRGCRGNRVALSKGGDNTCCSASSLLPRRASLATGGCEALGTTYPHPSGWRPKREPKSRLPAPRRSGTRRAWYGQPR